MKKTFFPILILLLGLSPFALACSDFQLKAKDGSVIIGRSMEFPIDLQSEICIVPRGGQVTVVNKAGIKGQSWTAKYGFVGINAFKDKDTYVETINEKGLAMDGLVFNGSIYQPVVAGKYVPLDKLATWLMGNFATVDEVKAALADTNITISEMNKVKDMGMHVAIHDAAGHNLVVEFINGKMNIHDNPLGVMTNQPSFDWQLTNLRNYINLDSHDKKPKTINGVKIEPTGVGSGLLGLPGDWTPPSRFVRLANAIDAALPTKNAPETINLAMHLLNMVDIPKGVIKENPAPFIKLYGIAQWAVIKDLTNRVLYYRTYDNPTWKSVDLKKFNLNTGAAIKSIAMDDKQLQVEDVSGTLK